MIRLLAVDMDGTLLNPQGKVSPRNAMALKLLQKEGAAVVVCTGRGYMDAREPLAEAQISCDLICMNGSAVYGREGLQLHRQVMKPGQVAEILECCRNERIVFDIMTGRGSCTITPREELQRCYEEQIYFSDPDITMEQFHERFSYLTREELFSSGHDFYKISVISGDGSALLRVRMKLEEAEGISVVSSSPTNLEITHGNASKGNALIRYARTKGVSLSEIMAVGDSENDCSMLSLKLGAAVAMENGMAAAKAAARYITKSNAEDGVAWAVETFMLGTRGELQGQAF